MATRFDFKKRLGSGHFGEVWYAIDLGLGVPCAVKCIPPDKVISKNNLYQEAQVLKAAEHPNIVSVTDTGELSDGRIYLVMEYLPHGSLEDEAQGSYVPLSRAKRVMIDVLRGLSHAHLQGIVHRDIKPANIMIGNAQEGKLSDFGLALPDISKLDPGAVKGYQYVLHLAPEVGTFSDHTPLADIYACGVTFYRLVNGDSFLPVTSPQVARQMALRGEFPDRDKYRAFIPTSMKKLVNKAMSVDPADRYQSADNMRRALERLETAADWEEHLIGSGRRWVGVSRGRDLEIVLNRQKDGTWALAVRKAGTGKRLRRDESMCKQGMTERQAALEASRALQRFVTGRA
jgi:serine/threonine protein kinase